MKFDPPPVPVHGTSYNWSWLADSVINGYMNDVLRLDYGRVQDVTNTAIDRRLKLLVMMPELRRRKEK